MVKAPTQETADVHLTLVEQNLWILPEGRLEATIHLDQLAPAGSEIAVVIYQRLRSRSLFQASLEGDLGSPLATVSRPVGELSRDARGDARQHRHDDGDNGAGNCEAAPHCSTPSVR